MFKKRGWEHLDGDALAKSLYVPGTPLMRLLKKEFGAGVIGAGGCLDTKRLGEIVFPDPGRRAVLNRMVHPRLLRLLKTKVRQVRARGGSLVADLPVYFEMGAPELGMPIVLVQAPERVRIERLTAMGVPVGRARARARALRFGAAERRASAAVLDGTLPAGENLTLLKRKLGLRIR